MKKLIVFIFFIFSICLNVNSQNRDSIIISCRDTSYRICDTTIIQIPSEPSATIQIKGMYGHPDQVTIGNAASEHQFLLKLANYECNELNMYCRSYLYTESKRSQLAAFVRKAKESYGIDKVTVDVRLTNENELPGWKAYLAKYSRTISVVEPLTEFEPYVRNSSGVYNYPHFFYLVRTMGNLMRSYGLSLYFYEGWIGNNYANPQAAVDSMVKYCDRIYISNYVKVSDRLSTSTGLGAWDNRMDKRCNAIAVSCKKFNRKVDIVEIQSLEPEMCGPLHTCPETSINKCKSFYGSDYQKSVSEYNKSTTDVINTTNLIGRTIFYSKYAFTSQP